MNSTISTAPRLDDRAICITDNPVFAAVISSYFAKEGFYFPIFEFHKIKEPPKGIFAPISLETLCVHIHNRVLQLMPKRIVYAGLNEFQKSCFKFPKKLIIDIQNLEEINEKIWKYSNKFNEEVRCREANIIEGLLKAVRTKSRLAIDPAAEIINAQSCEGEGVFVIEKEELDIAAVATINLAFASRSNVEFIEGTDRKDSYRIKQDLEAAWDGKEGYSFEDQRDTLKKLINKIDFHKYKWATFLTRGIPYSLVLNDVLPTALLNRVAATHVIFDSLYKEDFDNYLYSSVIFSVPLNKSSSETVIINDESPKIASLLDNAGYLNVMLTNKLATKRNFSYFVEYFPYDVLHISSHGGGIKDGMFHRITLIDANGKDHKFDYYEVVDFEATGEEDENGEPLIGVTSMMVPIAFDGYPWASEELFANRTSEEIKSVETIFSDDLKMRDKIDFSVPTKEFDVPHSKMIECIDNIHQAQFHSIGGQGSPFIFNNSCRSWYEMGTSFVAIGARAYVGTLFRVLDSVAKKSAVIFYENALKGTDLMTSCYLMNKSIDSPRYQNIYAYWGIPWCFIRPLNKPRALAVKDVVDTMRTLADGYRRKSETKEGSLLKKTEKIIEFLEDKIHSIPAMYWRSVEIRYGSGMRIFRKDR